MNNLIYNCGGRKWVGFIACFVAIVVSHFMDKDPIKLATALMMIFGPFVGANAVQKFSERVVNIDAGPAKK